MNQPTWLQFDEDLSSSWGEEPAPRQIETYSFYKDTPEGEVVLHYDDVAHEYYRFDAAGRRVDIPGVTTVLGIVDKSKPLMRWAVKLAVETIDKGLEGGRKELSTEEFITLLQDAKTKHEQELEDAGKVGHRVHAVLEVAIKRAIEKNGGVVVTPVVDDIDPRVGNSVLAAMEWITKHHVRFIFTERKCYSRTYDVAGTGDGLAWVSSCGDPLCCPKQFVDHLSFVDWKTSRAMRTTYPLQVAIYQFAYIEETNEAVTDRWVLKLDKESGKLSALYCPPETFEDDLECFLACLHLYRTFNSIEDRRNAEAKAKRETIRAQNKLKKEEIEEVERERKAAERGALSVAKKQWDADAAAHYKEMRAQKISKVEAERMRDEKFPRDKRPGFRGEDTQQVEPTAAVQAAAPVAVPKKQPATGNVVSVGGKKLDLSGIPGRRSIKLR